MNYTLIAYKSNNNDYCRGCLMASYDSDFELFCTDSEEELLQKWLDVRKMRRTLETREAGYDITILYNGKDIYNDNFAEHLRLEKIVDERLAKWSKEQDIRDEEEKKRQQQEREAREQRESLRQLAELKKKLGVD